MHRPALSPAHLEARRWFREVAAKAGMEVRVDGAGNHSARLRCASGSAKTLLLGSHLDSVPQGGRYDGALGVLCALEVLQTVRDAGCSLPVDLEAIDFTDEEGAHVGLMGSRALAGRLGAADLAPHTGQEAFDAALQRAGLTREGILTAQRDGLTWATRQIEGRTGDVLDLGLPERPGLEVLANWRKAGLKTPVLILTARDTWQEKVQGLQQGADDYLTKPFSPRELVARIKAAFELGRRLLVERPMDRCQIRSPADAANLLMGEMGLLEQEELRTILLDTKNRVIAIPIIYVGSVNTTMIRVSELFREAIRRNCPALIIAHNHPSSDPSPSPEDLVVTRQAVEAGKLLDIDVLDHLIIGPDGKDGSYFSFADEGLIRRFVQEFEQRLQGLNKP